MRKGFQSCLLLSSGEAETAAFVRTLHQAGIAILEREVGPAGIALALSQEFDVVAVVCSDEEEPGLIAKIAVAGMPVVALFHQATAAVAAKSLTLGADACLQLDADARLVTAQMHAVLRRHGIFERQPSRDPGVLQIGDLFVDVDRCEVQRAGAVIPLSPSEFRIIEYLARQGGRVSRPHEILNAVSDDYRYMPHEARDVFKVYARRIRRKLEVAEHEPRYLITVRGFGYRLEGGQLCSTSDVTARTAV